MKPKIAKLTKEQRARAEEKVWELYEWMTRVLIVLFHSDLDSALEADPDVFADGIALSSYITSGTAGS